MSAADGITAALVYDAIRRPSRGGGVSIGEYNALIDDYNDQLSRTKRFQTAYAELAKHFDTSVDNSHVLITYINVERIANKKKPLLMSDIYKIVNNNYLMSSINNQINKESMTSNIGIISESDRFWDHINRVVYEPFAQQLDDMGETGREVILKSYDRKPSIDGDKSLRISEMEKRIAELERNNRTLQEQNDKLVTQNRELKQQNMSFQEEAMNNMGIDLDAIVIPTFQPKQKETVEVKQNKGTISGSSHSPSN